MAVRAFNVSQGSRIVISITYTLFKVLTAYSDTIYNSYVEKWKHEAGNAYVASGHQIHPADWVSSIGGSEGGGCHQSSLW